MAGEQCWVPAPPSQQHDACMGKEETIGPFLSYVASPPSPNAAVILISDAFGFGAPLLRKLADKVAASGYFVVVPDFFGQDLFTRGINGNDWLKNHQPMDVIKDTRTLVEVLKGKGLLSVGAVGFCWGGKVVAELAKDDCLKAGVFCHPSLVTVQDIKEIKIPLAILAAEIDQSTPPALVKQFQEVLETKKEVESFVQIYPGVAHGWTVRYDVNDEKAVESAEKAHHEILEWFRKFLH